MDRIRIGVEWLDRLLPDGFPTHSSTLISGPGGSGKPLIGDTVVASWLRQGGSVVFMSLQYPTTDFITTSLKRVAGLDLAEYAHRTVFLELDTTRQDWTEVHPRHLKANLVIPEVWEEVLAEAHHRVPEEGPGILLFASAINLLLFSPTYGSQILARLEDMLQHDRRWTLLFSASTTAKAQEIARLEATADNLWMTRSEKDPFRLYLRIVRMKGVRFLSEEILVPIPPDALGEVKEVAEHSRKRVIPQIMRI